MGVYVPNYKPRIDPCEVHVGPVQDFLSLAGPCASTDYPTFFHFGHNIQHLQIETSGFCLVLV